MNYSPFYQQRVSQEFEWERGVEHMLMLCKIFKSIEGCFVEQNLNSIANTTLKLSLRKNKN